MEKPLIKYFGSRIDDKKKGTPGPVITISREFGCPAKQIGQKLAEKLNLPKSDKVKRQSWKVISKELLAKTAKELNINPAHIKYVFDYEKKGVFDEIISSQAKKYYKSDRKIRQTIAQVIRSVAEQGYVIIIGRGGIAITRDIQRSIHVRLVAPLEWRAAMISQRQKISLAGSRELAIDIDKKRKEFRNQFEGKDTDYTSPDITYNCMTVKMEEIIASIIKFIELKKILK